MMPAINVSSFSQPVSKTINSGWKFRETGSGHWYDASVPGTVHTDLMAAGLIKDPFYRLNEKEVQWVDKKDWEYETVFDTGPDLLDKRNIYIECLGLDTYADIYLNGSQIIKADNMFRNWRADIKHLLKPTGNILKVFFHSPVNHDIPKYDSLPYHYPAANDQSGNGGLGDKKVSVFARKAGYHYGWDWGPRLVTSGIWRNIIITGWDGARINDIFFEQKKISPAFADIKAHIEISAESNIKNVEICISDTATSQVFIKKEIDLTKGNNLIEIPFRINSPRLWWANGLGPQNMYDFLTTIKEGSGVLDEKLKKTGIRSLKLITSKDKDGHTFHFELNGHPLFCKGANYIPQDNFVTRVTDSQYIKTIGDAAKANMNMLRVWGGGIYENDIFYDLCDKYGILVWQDFMFACSMYPAEGEFLENVRREAEYNVKRLRNHACIALWCGNNEIQEAWYSWHWKEQSYSLGKKTGDKVWNEFKNLYYKTLPETVNKYDPQVSYRPSSPFSDYGKAQDFTEGDYHYWNIWHGKKPISEYNRVKARFFSEYGMQSFPDFISVKRYAPLESDRNIYGEVMMSHQRGGPEANELIESYIKSEYTDPADFADFLYVNQLLQADAIKTAIEAHRRSKPYCMGTLYWQLDDCWPVASWSGIDYYGRWKALHYFAKKAYEDILVSPIKQGNELYIYLVSDRLSDTRGKLDIKIMKFDGQVIYSHISEINIPADKVVSGVELKVTDIPGNIKQNDIFVRAVFTDENGKSYDNNYVMLKQKEMNYPRTEIKTEIEPLGIDKYSLTLTSPFFARAVYVEIDDPRTFVSDNYFDLLPRSPASITVSSDLTEDELKKSLKIYTLANIK
jgi:beta-mannosidase